MYNCSKDSGALKQQYNIYLQNVFDVKVFKFLAQIIFSKRGYLCSTLLCYTLLSYAT